MLSTKHVSEFILKEQTRQDMEIIGNPIMLCSVSEENFSHRFVNTACPTLADIQRIEGDCPPHERAMGVGKRWRNKGITVFEMPAAPTGGYSVIPIFNGMARVWHPEQQGEDNNSVSKPRHLDEPTHAIVVAQQLTRVWGGTNSAAKGVGIIKGPKPTADELKWLNEMQRRWAKARVDEADTKYFQHRPHQIGEVSMQALEFLGMERPWKNKSVSNKICPACGEGLRALAIQCSHCSTSLPGFWVQMITEGWKSLDDITDDVVKPLVIKRLEGLKIPIINTVEEGKKSAKA